MLQVLNEDNPFAILSRDLGLCFRVNYHNIDRAKSQAKNTATEADIWREGFIQIQSYWCPTAHPWAVSLQIGSFLSFGAECNQQRTFL